MTLKKLTLAAAASFALASGAFAADQSSSWLNGQWGAGLGMFDYTGTAVPAAVLTYLTPGYLVQAGMGYTRQTTANSTSQNTYDTYLGFGLRNMMNNQVSFDYGVNGNYGMVSNKADNQKNPYALGVFVGLDFQPVQDVLFTASIQPYTYVREQAVGQESNTKTSRVLSAGSVSVSYLF